MATMILLSAIPGSGKSTWARAYQETHPNTYIVASDEIRFRLTGSVQNFEHEALIWETFLKEINEHAHEECTVIADATNLQNRYRRFYCESTPDFDRHVLVVFDIPFETCLRQNRMRSKGKVVCDEAMVSLYNEFEPPLPETIDLYDEYIVIDENYEQRREK